MVIIPKKAQVSAALGIEGRYNFKGTPWDCGLMLDLSTARRGYEHLYNDGYDRWQSNRTLALAATGEYNLRQGTIINPFAGAALGVAFNDVVGDKYFPSKGTSMLLRLVSALNSFTIFVLWLSSISAARDTTILALPSGLLSVADLRNSNSYAKPNHHIHILRHYCDSSDGADRNS